MNPAVIKQWNIDVTVEVTLGTRHDGTTYALCQIYPVNQPKNLLAMSSEDSSETTNEHMAVRIAINNALRSLGSFIEGGQIVLNTTKGKN